MHTRRSSGLVFGGLGGTRTLLHVSIFRSGLPTLTRGRPPRHLILAILSISFIYRQSTTTEAHRSTSCLSLFISSCSAGFLLPVPSRTIPYHRTNIPSPYHTVLCRRRSSQQATSIPSSFRPPVLIKRSPSLLSFPRPASTPCYPENNPRPYHRIRDPILFSSVARVLLTYSFHNKSNRRFGPPKPNSPRLVTPTCPLINPINFPLQTSSPHKSSKPTLHPSDTPSPVPFTLFYRFAYKLP